MQVSSVAVGMLAMFTFPIITILLEPFFTTRKLMVGDLVAGLVVLAGLGIMVGPGLTDLRLPVTQGVLFGLFSALLFALRNLLQKYLYVGESSDGLILHQVIAIALVLIPFVDYPRAQALNGAGVVNILLLGLLSTAAGHTLLAFSLKQLPAKSVALIQCLQPPLAALLAWWVIGETPGAAVVNLVRQASVELAPYNVLVTGIAPGPFRTGIAGGRISQPEVETMFAAMVPLSRIAEPDEIKGLALLLASDASSYMTGVTVAIDGGTTAR
jgi:threonine/homoserine efflux transporter RhtA